MGIWMAGCCIIVITYLCDGNMDGNGDKTDMNTCLPQRQEVVKR